MRGLAILRDGHAIIIFLQCYRRGPVQNIWYYRHFKCFSLFQLIKNSHKCFFKAYFMLCFSACFIKNPALVFFSVQVNLVYTYETKHSLCMVLTMMSGGDLQFHIHKLQKGGLDLDRVCFYAAEVCCGLIHLHQKSIVYRWAKSQVYLV